MVGVGLEVALLPTALCFTFITPLLYYYYVIYLILENNLDMTAA